MKCSSWNDKTTQTRLIVRHDEKMSTCMTISSPPHGIKQKNNGKRTKRTAGDTIQMTSTQSWTWVGWLGSINGSGRVVSNSVCVSASDCVGHPIADSECYAKCRLIVQFTFNELLVLLLFEITFLCVHCAYTGNQNFTKSINFLCCFLIFCIS